MAEKRSGSDLEDEATKDRKVKIQKLIESIQKTSTHKRRNAQRGCKKQEKAETRTGRGRRKRYKLYLGWRHYSKGEFRVVTASKGGGTRSLEYDTETPVNCDDLIEVGKTLFYPDGKSDMGQIKDMDVAVTNFKGDILHQLTDLSGKNCSLQEYLKVRGLFSSQLRLYFRSKAIAESQTVHQLPCIDNTTCVSSEADKQLLVNGLHPGLLETTYMKMKMSAYSSHDITVICNETDCSQLSGQPEIETYDAFDDGFVIMQIKKNGIFYLQKSDAEYTFPSVTVESKDVILHGPSEIHGIGADGKLKLGVVTKCHNQGCVYQWYKDGILLVEGHNRCVISVEEAGLYTVAVVVDELCYLPEAAVVVSVVSLENPVIPPSAEEVSISSLTSKSIVLQSASCTDSSPRGTPEDASIPVTAGPSRATPEDSPLCISHSGSAPQPTLRSTTRNGPEEVSIEMSVEIPAVLQPTIPSRISNKGISMASAGKIDVDPQSSTLERSLYTDRPSATSSCSDVAVPNINIRDITMQEEIGRGAFGIVYKGAWVGTTVAVKQITVKRIKIMRKSIDRELQIHSRIRHPNIVLLMAYAMDKDQLYLVSEFVDGSNLDDVLFGPECENNPAINSMSKKMAVAVQICQAVSYLHSLCPIILHRDIKPENILVTMSSSVVKLCDMGLSKLKTMNTFITTMAGCKAIQPGTPAYQAPEVFVENKSASLKTDVWSLSCTLVELFSETPIWCLDSFEADANQDDDTGHAYIKQKMTKKEIPDGLANMTTSPGIPKVAVEVLSKGLQYDANERPTAIDILSVCKGLV